MSRRLAVLAACAALAACAKAPQRYGSVPSFRAVAVSSDGAPAELGSDELKGRPWVVSFVFTSCPGPCPAVSTRMSELQKKLPPRVGLLTITVDPKRDTPEVLRAYARRFRADPARWRFLRVEPARLDALVVRGFKLGLGMNGGITHSTKLVLLDGDLGIRGYYDFDDDGAAARLSADAAYLASRGP